MVRLSIQQKWLRFLPWLRREFPPKHPVAVRRIPAKRLKGVCGDCGLVSRRFVIRICREQAFRLVEDTLIHEWAHALTWDFNKRSIHGEEWGLAYARIYRAWLGWNYGRPLENGNEEG